MKFNRLICNEINALKYEFRIITLIGPRQAGKTTLCKALFPDYQYVSLEDPDHREWATEDPKGFLQTYRASVIFDEIQRVPSLLSYLQRIVDEDDIKAQFILTGSHQLALSEAVTQSLAGRTALVSLLPLSFAEVQSGMPEYAEQSVEAHLIGGFMPGRLKDNGSPHRFYRAYFQTYVERDVRTLIQLKEFSKFENCVRLLAGRVGQMVNQSSLATEVGVSATTIGHWLSVLESSFIIQRLQPYFENFGKRIVKAPKLYFVDTGLAAWLLGIESESQMQRDPLKGNLFENMVVMEAFKARLHAGRDPRLYYFRDSHGHEVDLVWQNQRELCPIEIKAGQTWQSRFLKGTQFFQGLSEKASSAHIIYAGEQERSSEDYQLLNYLKTAEIFESSSA